MDTLEFTIASLKLMLPAIVLIVGGCLLLCSGLIMKSGDQHRVHDNRNALGALSMLFIALAGFAMSFREIPADLGSGLFRLDESAIASERLALIGGAILVLISWSTAPKRFLAEYYGCLVIMLGGIPLVGAANDLVSLFLGLELVSIPTYILLGIVKRDNLGMEAAIKYFLMSAFSAAFFMLGLSYLFGTSGSTNLQVIYQTLGSETASKLTIVALLFVLCGLAFRITAVPFHFYAPDVFEGTSLSMASAMAYLPKVAGFVALIRLLGTQLGPDVMSAVVPILLACSALTMIIGNFMAAAQANLRRLLAYSSVAHSGYLLLALAALVRNNAEPVVLYSYLAAYAAMTLGFFACLAEIESAGGKTIMIADLSGMFYRRPAASIGMAICLLSMIGLPLTAGFWAKFLVFMSTTAAGMEDPISLGMGILMAVNAVIAAAYYWRVMSKLFESSDAYVPLRVFRPSLFLAYTICVVLTLVWFFVPYAM
ncbi:MAG: NADH-quinone oxidoreductase subunit N [Pirellula sp.]|nr:NADH-quinone oxidoreductase subunit N [Pirellula sp.]